MSLVLCMFSSVSQCIQKINQAVDQGDHAQTLLALKNPGAGLYGVTSECSETYQNDLKVCKDQKRQDNQKDQEEQKDKQENQEGQEGEKNEEQKDENQQKDQAGDSAWVKHWVKGGHHYYYNLSTGEGTWVEPEGFTPNSSQLGKDDIQGVISGVTSAYNRDQLWRANETLITRLQARCRGFLIRRNLQERKAFLQNQNPAVTTIQAHWKGYKQRKNYKERKQFLKDHNDQAVKIQSMVRMHQARKKYKDRLKYFKDHIDDVVKIQAFIRANKARDDYKTLINADDPPMGVVRKFVHLLDQSDQDFQEELELMKLREEVITNIRSNQTLEKDLNLMDIKIGLLVKNKITLQDVVSHSKQGNRGGLKALNKDKRVKLEAYQHLFYHLQTNPSYLAKLIFQMPQNKSTSSWIRSFSLVQLRVKPERRISASEALQDGSARRDQVEGGPAEGGVTGNPTVIKMVVSFHRGARGQNALRQILAPVVKETIDDKTLNIKTEPVDIYKSWVNHMETETGEASKLPYDVTPEQAMSHEEVRTRLEASIKNMKNITDKFLLAITTSVDKIPYGMRFISKVLKDSLHEKFPDATEDELLQIVGNLLYYRYMNPAVVAPDAFDIIDVSAGGQLGSEQRRNLGSIAKMLQNAASNKMFYGDNAHLTPINEYLSNAHAKYRRFFLAACDVPSLEDKFNVDQYSDLVTVTKPVIYISMERWSIRTRTKRLIVDVIRFQPGETLTEILDSTASPEQEAEYQRAMQRRAQRDARTKDQTQDQNQDQNQDRAGSKQDLDDSLSLQGKKDKIKHNLQVCRARKSAAAEPVPGAHQRHRQGEVAVVTRGEGTEEESVNLCVCVQDIRNQRRYRQRRKAELVRLQQTNVALNSKTKFYHAQIDQYNQYIKTCMDNLTKGKVSNAKAKKSKQVSHKYTASRLHEKGVLISIEDLQPNQYRNVIFEISRSENVGVFDVKAKLMGVHLETVQLEYQDLLQLQYEGVALMKLFDRATINVNLLIFLLNKKFYGK
ncbi:hypothetical protein WMY93_012842 [Mugilogobius chulae]|uniref:IQ motif containing GTPase activating protein 1 n=1 Tax=Mugilogobius chulae TaxID=88201 RepID=A0AAW0PA39_9GOBI